ncbi:DUF3487 family protein [Oceanicoccus sp. KOV_DT_Chl]|uniref:DUF3487 family protein n=1 Tax=Oceanicoccus sp. KOV_DT_Chl TaxID=1904639 RepID=UPI001F380521|nr:DUF3487 family protein [Oceanicoccus sp. KOV_DT_Chl]
MDFQQEINELLPLRLNAEPSIFRGCSLSELMLLVTVGGIVLVPGSVIVCGLFGYLMMGVGIGLLLVIAWVVIGATALQKLKRAGRWVFISCDCVYGSKTSICCVLRLYDKARFGILAGE